MTDIKLTPKRRKTIVIFGISSFVGSNLAEFFSKDYRVVGTYNKNPVAIDGVLVVPCDVLVKEEVQLVMFAFKPDFTIYCAGLSSIVGCHVQEELADALNTSGLFNVTEYCQRYKSQICYISSNFVFGGEDKKYIEMDIPDANTVYGKTQASAEFYIQKTSLNYIIFRSCPLYGRGFQPNKKTRFEIIERALHNNETISMDEYIQTGFLDVQYLALVLKICFEKGVQNRLFQVSTSDMVTHYDFSKLYCEVFGESKTFLTRARWPFPIAASTAVAPTSEKLKFKLDITNIEGFLNIELPSVRESLEFTKKRFFGVTKKSKAKKSGGEGVTFI
jgi:dTDP-4-dehydrorhamnose reductase